MFDLHMFVRLAFGKPRHPSISNLRETSDDSLYFDGLIRGLLIVGDSGMGKTILTVLFMIAYLLDHPDDPVFSLDASGSLTNDFVETYHYLPQAQFESIHKRVVYDRPGDDTLVIPKPLFSSEYGLSIEDQVQKAVDIIEKLNSEKLQQTPMMATSIQVTAPNLFRLLASMKNENGESWQISEAKKMLIDSYKDGLLGAACKKYGHLVPNAKWYLEKELLRENLTPVGREARTSALISALGEIETNSLRARYGYPTPSITPKEIIEKGLIYLWTGEKLSNQKKAKAWVFWEEYSSIKAVINQRTPHDPDDKPVLLIMDEAYQPFTIKGMAEEIGQIPTFYRSRKLQLVIIIQALWQLNDVLKEQIWNLGNIVTFSLENHNDAYAFAQQLFKYDRKSEKSSSNDRGGNPVYESDRGQYLQAANWIQNLKWRQVVMRRYINGRDKEPFVNFVNMTREKPTGQLPKPLHEIKEDLFKRYAISVKDALKVINARKLIRRSKKRPTVE